jgi:hypothetical protein
MPWYSLTPDNIHSPQQARAYQPMFKWLVKQFTQADDDIDSLGSENGLEAFLEALPVTIPVRTVEALGEPFEHAPALEIAPERLRIALLRLDERAQEALDLVWRELFADSGGRTIADTAWLTLARYYRNVHTGYRVCLDALQGKLSDAERSDAVLMACRAMAALGRYKHMLRLRYRDVDARYWENLNGLVAWSRDHGSTNTLVELYPKSGVQSSIEREHLIALLFDVAPIGNFLPTQMAALDLLLRRFAANYQFSENYHESAPFVVDSTRSQSAQRWLRGLALRPGHCFFGIGRGYAQIAGLRKQFKETQKLPSWLAVTQLDRLGYEDLLDLLLAHWSVEPPQRRDPRERSEGEVMVTHGVAQVRRMIAASEFARSGGQLNYEENTPYDYRLFERLNFGSVAQQRPDAKGERQQTPMEIMRKFELEGDRQMTERWALFDVSVTGLGATAHAHGGWARVGMLVGFRELGSLEWQTGVLRRLMRSAQGKLSIGVLTMHGTTSCARLRFGDKIEEANPWVAVGSSGESFHDAILLRNADDASLLVEPGLFVGSSECMLSFDKRWHKARLERSIETGFDYERVAITFV